MSVVDKDLVQDLFSRISTNVSMLIDREIGIEEVDAGRANQRPAGQERIHISFKLSFKNADGGEGHGCVLMPLPDALSLACYLMMIPEAEVVAHRDHTELDQSSKDAMLELANFIGAAVDETVREMCPGHSARSGGCQGVRPDVRPALTYEEGSELVVGRAKVRIHEFPVSELIAILPVLPIAA